MFDLSLAADPVAGGSRIYESDPNKRPPSLISPTWELGKGKFRGQGCASVGPVVPFVRKKEAEKKDVRMATKIKDEAQKLIESLPDDSTWDDLMQQIYVRQAIEAGLADSQAGRTTSVETLRAEFGLK